jgi:hypothetical protein
MIYYEQEIASVNCISIFNKNIKIFRWKKNLFKDLGSISEAPSPYK